MTNKNNNKKIIQNNNNFNKQIKKVYKLNYK